MAAIATAASINTTLSQWLRLLWDMNPPLLFDSVAPFIQGGAIHLPARSHWRQHSAAAAHAAAHLVYSPAAFDGEGLGTIARALTALLEDARVEALAIRELPGLARLWRPLHTATPALGTGFEALMQRLARTLADPDYDDPNPWVRKGRMLFYLDAGLGLLALRTPAEVRRAATLLGHDIGQMRLQFNAKTYRAAPDYRDDHRWMWAADVLSAAPPPARVDAGSFLNEDDPEFDAAGEATLHPEWDRLIARVRPDWARVVERPAPHAAALSNAIDDAVRQTGRRLRGPLRVLARHSGVPRRSDEGDVFDLGALVEWCVARRLRHALGASDVYRGVDRRTARAAVWLLIDQSASTAAAYGSSGHSVLQAAIGSAAAAASALQAIGVPCAIAGFSSRGRHEVNLVRVKALDQPVDALMAARLQALRPGGSTRLGAALRHAASRLAGRGGEARWVIVLSDGQPHDVDVHDPRYLVEDARHAVRHAARLAVQMACIVLEAQRGAEPWRIFGSHRVQALQGLRHLPRVVQRLLACAG
jgi:hypothetical protein